MANDAYGVTGSNIVLPIMINLDNYLDEMARNVENHFELSLMFSQAMALAMGDICGDP